MLGNAGATIDFADGRFVHYATSLDVLASSRGSLGGLNGLPSVGSCTVSPYGYQGFGSSLVPNNSDPVNQVGLDAGSALNIAGPLGAKQLPKQNRGSPQQPDYVYKVKGSIIAGGFPGFTPVTPSYLSPGSYTPDDGSGGTQVGAFSAMLAIPGNTVVWTNESAMNNIARSQNLTVTWSGGAAGGIVAIFGGSADPSTGAGAAFQCVAAADAGKFTLPAWLLSALPASVKDPIIGLPVGFLALASTLAQPIRFEATGVDVGFFLWAELQSTTVVYQ